MLLLTQRNIANLVHKWHQDDQMICSSHSPPLVSYYATTQLEMRTRALKRTKKTQGCFLPDACCSWCRRTVACVESRPSDNYAHQAQHAGHTSHTWRRRRMQPASMLCRPSGAHERASHVTLAGHSYRTHAAHPMSSSNPPSAARQRTSRSSRPRVPFFLLSNQELLIPSID